MRTTLLTIGMFGLLLTSAVPPAAARTPRRATVHPRTVTTAKTASRTTRRTLLQDIRRRASDRVAKSSAANARSSSSRPASAPTGASRVESPTFDPKLDGAVRSQHLLLGEVTPIIAGARLFSNLEPIDSTEVEVLLGSSATSVSQLLIYDETGRYLGPATRTSSTVYTLNLADGALQIPYRAEVSVYVRARLKDKDSGGIAGQDIQVDQVTVRGNGAWSGQEYGRSSTDTFSVFQSARGVITAIQNAGGPESVLVEGPGQELGQFRFSAKRSDPSARVRVTELRFQIESYGGVSLSNVVLRLAGNPDGTACDVISGEVVCSSIPDSIGSIGTEPATLRVYGDVTLATAGDAFLRLTINDPGTPFDAGALTWTDGTATFTWIGFDQPVVRGTSLKR